MKKTLAVAALAAMSTCTWGLGTAWAQNTPTASKSSHMDMKSSKSTMKGGAMGMADDAEFLKKAYEGGLAEISLARLAEERAESDKVKRYAKDMLTDHTMANQMIAGMLGGQMQNDNMAGTSGAGNDTDVSGTGNTGLGTGSGTGTGAGVGSSSAGNTGTDAGAADSTRIPTADPNTDMNDKTTVTSGNAGSSTADANSSSSSAGAMGNAPAPAPTNSTMNALSNVKVSPELKAKESYILSNELNAEHKALEARLSKLSGAEFDKEYMKAMVKDHTKMLSMVSAKANEDSKMADASPAQVWAKQHESAIRQHKEKATKLMEEMMNGKK